MKSRAEILQNVEKILTTPIGSEADKDFGSYVPILIKRPFNALAISAAANEAIANGESRVRVIQTEVSLDKETAGNVLLKVNLIIAGEQTVLNVSIPHPI